MKDKPELPAIDTIATSDGKIRSRIAEDDKSVYYADEDGFTRKVRSATKIRSTSSIVIQVPPLLS
ncbi:MAG: hypothetical protein ABSE80_12070 [Halobacteriota archaeon]